MKERHGDEPALRVVDQRRLPQRVGIPDLAAVGEEHALGLARRARGIRLHADLAGAGRPALERGRDRGQERLVLERAVGGGSLDDQVLEARHAGGEAAGALGHGAVGDHDHRLGVVDHVLERVVAHPRIEGHRDGAEPHRAEERLEEAEVIAEHEGHAIARAHAELAERVRHPIAARVELGEGQLAVPLDDRHPIGDEGEGHVEEAADIVGKHAHDRLVIPGAG